MPNVGDDGEAHGVFIHFLSQGRASDAAAVFQAGMLSDLLFSASHQPWKNFADPGGESIDKGFVDLYPPFGFALSASRPHIGVSKTLVFRQFKRPFFDQQPLALISLARS